jgi:uncharacterized protein with beta-barrel porin domain
LNVIQGDFMKTRLISAAVAAVITAWAPSSLAREAVVLPGVVTAPGELAGVDTTGAGILTVGDGQNINTSNDVGGAFTTSANNTGIINFLGNSTVTGFTGQIGTEYDIINAGAVGRTVNFNGAVFSRIFNVSGTGTVNFNGNVIAAPNFVGDGFINLGTGFSLTGAITTNTAGTGTLTLNGGSSVIGAIGGASGLRQINVVGGNALVTGAVQSLGFDLGANTLNITGALTPNAGATIATSFATNAVFGNIAVAGNSNVTSAITVVPTVGGLLTVGTTYMIVNGTAGGTVGTPVNVINNSPLFTFTGVPVNSDGDVRIILVAMTPLATIVTTPAAAAGAAILGINAQPSSDLLTVQNAIVVLPNTAAIDSALAQLAPGNTNLAAPWVAGQTTRLFEDLWMARMDEIQDMCCDACVPDNSGGPVNAHKCKGPEQHGNWWGKGFDSLGRQDDTNNMNGYQTRALGLMLAYDVPVNDETRVGLGGGYANTTIDGNHSNARTRFDSYQLTGYVSYAPGPWFVQGALIAGMDRYDGSRDIVFPGVNRKASGDYTGQQYTGLAMAGMHFYLNQVTVTPLASLQASHIHVGSYTEGGAGDVDLHVNSQDYDFVQSGLGVKAESVIKSGNGTYSPEVHVKWLHDFNSTTMEQKAAFTGGGTSFTTQGIKQDRELYNVGAGITFLSCKCDKNSWTVKGLYDYKWNESDYSSHQVSLMASIKF